MNGGREAERLVNEVIYFASRYFTASLPTSAFAFPVDRRAAFVLPFFLSFLFRLFFLSLSLFSFSSFASSHHRTLVGGKRFRIATTVCYRSCLPVAECALPCKDLRVTRVRACGARTRAYIMVDGGPARGEKERRCATFISRYIYMYNICWIFVSAQ